MTACTSIHHPPCPRVGRVLRNPLGGGLAAARRGRTVSAHSQHGLMRGALWGHWVPGRRAATTPSSRPPCRRSLLRIGGAPHYFFGCAVVLPWRAARISAINSAIMLTIASCLSALLPPRALALSLTPQSLCMWPHSPQRKHLLSAPPLVAAALAGGPAATCAAGYHAPPAACAAYDVGAARSGAGAAARTVGGQGASRAAGAGALEQLVSTAAQAAAPGRALDAPCIPSAVLSSSRASRVSGSRPPASLQAAHVIPSLGWSSTARCKMSIWASGPTLLAPA